MTESKAKGSNLKCELLEADITYRTIVQMDQGNPDKLDHRPNDNEIAGSMIRMYGDNALERWKEHSDLLQRYPAVAGLLRAALDPKEYDL
jgi:hypothetical protein